MPISRHRFVTAPGSNETTPDLLPRPRTGRPRDPAIDHRVVSATVRLLGEHGYAGLSMEAIAAEAGVTKPTIYRRWPSKAVLVADALERRRRDIGPPGDHGNLRDDLLAMVLDDHRALAAQSGVILGVAFAARGDQDLDDAIGLRVDEETHARFTAVLERAVARGELAHGVIDTRSLLKAIASMLLGLMFRSASDDAEFLTWFIDELLMPALTGPSPHDQEHLR